MNGDDKTETNKGIIYIVVWTLGVCSVIGVCTLAYCLVRGGDLNQALLTAFVGLTTGTLGGIGGILSKTSPTPTTTVATQVPPSSPPPPPTSVTIDNPPNHPVPTVDVEAQK